jgi:hypothetical protein
MPEIRTQLVRAKRQRRLIRLYRDGLDYQGRYSEGYVVGLSPGFVVLHRVADTILLDGYQVFRVADITKAWGDYPSRGFVEKALHLRNQRLEPVENLDLASVETVLSSAGAIFPLLSIHRERIYRDSCWIGQVVGMTDRTFLFRQINPAAEWVGTARYRFRDITKIDFGGRYEEALTMVAGISAKRAVRQAAPKG